MKYVKVVKNLELGWDDVIGVFTNTTREALEQEFPEQSEYVIIEVPMYETLEQYNSEIGD